MSRSSFSKAYEEIVNLEPMGMTFTIEDADLDKLHDVLKDINVKECPWFEVQDKYGNKAKYYREPRKKGKWIGYNADDKDWQRDDGSPIFMNCSECHEAVINNGSAHWNFCPNCGADMRGEEE